MTLAKTLQDLGYDLPPPAPPAANYIPYMVVGNLVFISGQIPMKEGRMLHMGQVGYSVSIERGIECAELCGLNILAQANAAVGGDWSKIKRCVKLGGFVSCKEDFTDQPKIINGASDLMIKVLGEEKGKHTRFAVGAPSLPLGAPVEIEAIFEIEA